MSLKIFAFYGNQFLGTETTIDEIDRIPDESYILMNGRWYFQQNSALKQINKPDLPPEIKAQLLLLNIQP